MRTMAYFDNSLLASSGQTWALQGYFSQRRLLSPPPYRFSLVTHIFHATHTLAILSLRNNQRLITYLMTVSRYQRNELLSM